MIAIKGIEMPRTCGVCKFAYFQEDEYSWYSCSLLHGDADEGSNGSYRQPECPLVDIEDRPEGEWIEHKCTGVCGDVAYDYSKYQCSECGEWTTEYSNFCPGCGADMRGDTE